jgi:hypothetical protein
MIMYSCKGLLMFIKVLKTIYKIIIWWLYKGYKIFIK